MKSIADQLPPEIAQQIHPNRRKNEAGYWAVRDQLLDQYRNQWIGFADGMVIAFGSSPVTVFQTDEAPGRHPFFICVGREEEPCRIRREKLWRYLPSSEGNDQIVSADHLAFLRQVCMDLGMNSRGGKGKVQDANPGNDRF